MAESRPPSSPPVPHWHAEPPQQVLHLLAADASGLTPHEASARLARHGPNRLPAPPRRGPLQRLLLQFHNPLIHVLLLAGIATGWLAHYTDAAVIFGVVAINAVIGFIQEGKAERALDAVRAMLASRAMVLRGGERREIAADELVPGDLVLLESGTRVPADLRLLYAKNLRINEAALTGESLPTDKGVEPVAVAAPIGDRTAMAYSGTVVASGQGRGVVVATGPASEIGRIGALVAAVETLATPLTRRLGQFSRQITLFILALSLITFGYGHYYGGMPAMEIFLAVVGLAVAAIPEGLPAIVTITLAIGTRIMAQRRAIVRRLPAVETLGSVTVICTDKTGTLTRNEMTAVAVRLPGRLLAVSGVGYAPEGGFHEGARALDAAQAADLQALARCALLCNDARLAHDEENGWTLAGDPTEGALLTLALKAGLEPDTVAAAFPRLDEIPFESGHRFMATLHHDHAGRVFALLKGAPEAVLRLCVRDASGAALEPRQWERHVASMAHAGQRVLALAECELASGTAALAMADIRPRFTLLGLVGMMDPPRPEAVEAVAACRRAGVRVLMITGDHAITAAAIGRELGLDAKAPLTGAAIDGLDDAALDACLQGTDVIARASPEHKLRLVAALQARGELVAMTGDGVNDAPALKLADIGVAMGLRGTDAAREAADLVLTDDNFATIAGAVREGRTVFDNIKKALVFILPTNAAQAGVILLAVLVGMALPITAAQILWVNMVTAVTLALALAFEPAEADVMRRPPRPPQEPLITRAMLARIGYMMLLMVAFTFAVFHWELQHGRTLAEARTAAVNMLVFGEIVYLFNVRQFTAGTLVRGTLYGNPVAFWASAGLILLQLVFTYAGPMQRMFHTASMDAAPWALILALGALLFFAVAAEKAVLRRLGIQRM